MFSTPLPGIEGSKSSSELAIEVGSSSGLAIGVERVVSPSEFFSRLPEFGIWSRYMVVTVAERSIETKRKEFIMGDRGGGMRLGTEADARYSGG